MASMSKKQEETEISQAKDDIIRLALGAFALHNDINNPLSAGYYARWFDTEVGTYQPVPRLTNCAEYMSMAAERIVELGKEHKLWTNGPRNLGIAAVQKFVVDTEKRAISTKLENASKALTDAAKKIKESQADTMPSSKRKRRYEEAFEGLEEVLTKTAQDVQKRKKL